MNKYKNLIYVEKIRWCNCCFPPTNKKEMKDNFFVLDKQNFFIKRAQYKINNYFYLGYLVNHDKVWDI